MRKKKSNTKNIALSGIICALSTVVMFATVFPYMTFSLPAVAGALLAILLIEIGYKWAIFGYVTTSVLSFLLCQEKEAVMLFIGFFGIYPVLKSLFEKIPLRPLEYLLKILTFNILILASYAVIIFVLNIPMEGMEDFGRYTALILIAMGNGVFIIYDIALTRAFALYSQTLSKYIRKGL